jgi:ATP-dependent DNA helicase DinG
MNDIASFRPGQLESSQALINSAKSRMVLQAPTGAGKSVMIRVPGLAMGQRTLILTRTIELQKQYETQGVTTLFGRDNYICTNEPMLTAAHGICRLGERCRFFANGCLYFEDKARAQAARTTVLNYAYFFRDGTFTDYDWIMCDEGHAVPAELTSAFEIVFSTYAIRELNLKPPAELGSIPEWIKWSTDNEGKLKRKAKTILRDKAVHLHALNNAVRRLEFVKNLDNWVIESNGFTDVIRPIWPMDLARQTLLNSGRKIVFTSATIDPVFTMDMLGVDIGSVDTITLPSSFPIGNRPIYTQMADYRPRHNAQEEEYQALTELIDRIVESYPGKRGLIHTGSYALANRILGMARNKARLLSHDSHSRAKALLVFRSQEAREQGIVLVSPSMAEGVDLPYDQCEFIIVAKMPYANLKSPLWQARFKSDLAKAQFAYTSEAISLVVQACGRGVRSEDDKCDTWILDFSFMRELKKNGNMFPRWFLDAIQ